MTEIENRAKLPGTFKIFVISKFFATTGSGFYLVLIPWMVLSLTKSPLLVGIAEGFAAIPLITSFFIGAMIDKVKMKNYLFIFSILGIGLSSLSFLLALSSNTMLFTVIVIFIPILLISYLGDVQTTISSFMDKILLSNEQLIQGISLRRGTRSIAKISGIVFFGFFIIISLYSSIIFLAILYFLSLFAFIFVSQKTKFNESSKRSKDGTKTDIFQGIRKFLSVPFLKELTLLGICLNLFYGMIFTGIAVLIGTYLNLSGVYFSLIIMAWAIGEAAGSVISGVIKRTGGRLLEIAMIMCGSLFVIFFAFSLRHSYFPLLPLVFLIGFISGIVNVLIYTLMIKNTPSDLIGGTFGAFNSLFGGVTFLSGLIAGILLTYLLAPFLFLIIGASFLIIGFFSLTTLTNLKKISM